MAEETQSWKNSDREPLSFSISVTPPADIYMFGPPRSDFNFHVCFQVSNAPEQGGFRRLARLTSAYLDLHGGRLKNRGKPALTVLRGIGQCLRCAAVSTHGL